MGNTTNKNLHTCVLGESQAHGGNRLRFREVIFYERGYAYPEYVVSFTRVPQPVDAWNKLKQRTSRLVQKALAPFFEAMPKEQRESAEFKDLNKEYKKLESPRAKDVMAAIILCRIALEAMSSSAPHEVCGVQDNSPVAQALLALGELETFFEKQEKMRGSHLAEQFLSQFQQPEPEAELHQ